MNTERQLPPERQAVDQAVRRAGLTLKEASIRLGRNETYLQQYVRYGKPAKLDGDDRQKLAELLKTSEASLREPEGPTPTPNADMTRLLTEDLVGERDLPIYASAEGGPYGMVVDSRPIEWVKRPAPLIGVPNAFGTYVVGDSMEPAYFQGDMILIHPSRPVSPGDDVLITARRIDGEVAALVKRLLRATADQWKVKQYNEPKEFSLKRSEWQRAYVVVGKYNRR